ncbi:hypothetical protein LguiB_021769 [Lonicera macranthoides]
MVPLTVNKYDNSAVINTCREDVETTSTVYEKGSRAFFFGDLFQYCCSSCCVEIFDRILSERKLLFGNGGLIMQGQFWGKVGLFIPVILAGGSYGWIVGTLIGPVSNLDVGLFTLLATLPLVMLVFLDAKTMADTFNKGVYDRIMEIKGVAIFGSPCRAVHEAVSSGFPVTDHAWFTDAPVLCGLVLRSHLLVLLQGKKFTKDGVDGE